MKRYFFTVLIAAMLFSATGNVQILLGGDETKGIRFNAISAPVKLSLDGSKSMSLTPVLFGVALDVKLAGAVFPIGLYTSLSVDSETTRSR